MFETMSIDSKTIIIKAENEKELSEIINFINKKDKESNLKSFLDFASVKSKTVGSYKFNREDCYAE